MVYRSSPKYWTVLTIEPVPIAPKMHVLDPKNLTNREPIVIAGTVTSSNKRAHCEGAAAVAAAVPSGGPEGLPVGQAARGQEPLHLDGGGWLQARRQPRAPLRHVCAAAAGKRARRVTHDRDLRAHENHY